MRFMIVVKATKDSEAGVMPENELIARMHRYHEELANAGMLLEGSGLQPSSKGWRIKYSGDKTTVVDGPFAETKELIAGYTLIQAKSAKRPSSGPGVIRTRPATARLVRSRCGNCSSSRISSRARPWRISVSCRLS